MNTSDHSLQAKNAPTDTFHWNIRVYYEDTDAGGVVFYANYLKFFERARTEWLRAAGVSQHDLAQTHGVIFVVKNTAVEYHAPAKLDDQLRISVVIEKRGHASVQFKQEAWRINGDYMNGDEPQLLSTGRIKIACVGVNDFRPCEIPDGVLHKIE